jgi:hypothetical protein
VTTAVKAGTLTTGTPTVSGTLAVGGTVTAKPGTWTAGTVFAYQWYADGKAISKATASTYRIPSSLVGKRLSVRATGKLAGYTSVTKGSASTAKVALAGSPAISGSAAVGFILTAKPGTWTSGTSFAYQWYADGKAVAGGTHSTLKLSGAQAAKTITVRVTGAKSGYGTFSKTTAATLRVSTWSAPSIHGVAYVTGTLTASTGTWTSGTTYTYRWLANGVTISGATKASLAVGGSLNGKRITVQVTGRKSGYTTVTATSGAVTIRPGVSKPASKYVCPAGYPIKGNQTTRYTTDWIYHVPGGQYYAVTAPEQCFATEAAAQQAGYRKSLR